MKLKPVISSPVMCNACVYMFILRGRRCSIANLPPEGICVVNCHLNARKKNHRFSKKKVQIYVFFGKNCTSLAGMFDSHHLHIGTICSCLRRMYCISIKKNCSWLLSGSLLQFLRIIWNLKPSVGLQKKFLQTKMLLNLSDLCLSDNTWGNLKCCFYWRHKPSLCWNLCYPWFVKSPKPLPCVPFLTYIKK